MTVRATTMTTTGVTSGVYANGVSSAPFTAKATLLDMATQKPVPSGTPVIFWYGGAASATVTTAAGAAQVSYYPGASSGTYKFSATFAGDATYAATSSTSSVTVQPRPTFLSTGACRRSTRRTRWGRSRRRRR